MTAPPPVPSKPCALVMLHRIFLGLALLLVGVPASAVQLRVVALFNNKVMVEIDGKQRLLKAGEPSTDGIELVRSDFEEAVIRVNGKEDRYNLSDRVSSTFAETRVREARIPQRNGSYLVTGEINGRRMEMIVDTGATAMALSSTAARSLGVDYTRGAETSAQTASGIVRAWQVDLDQVRVGELEQTHVPAMVLEGDFPSKALLGMTFLRRVEMIHDDNMLILRQNP